MGIAVTSAIHHTRVALLATCLVCALGCSSSDAPGDDDVDGDDDVLDDDDCVIPPQTSEIVFSVGEVDERGGEVRITCNDLASHELLFEYGDVGSGIEMNWGSPCYLATESKLALCSGDGSHIGLFTMETDATGITRHLWIEDTHMSGAPCPIACSPTAPLVAISPRGKPRIVDVSSDGSPSVPVDTILRPSSLVWSASGSLLLLSGDGIATVAQDGSGLTVLRDSGFNARFNPQEDRIVFEDRTATSESLVHDIYLANVDGSEEHTLIPGEDEGEVGCSYKQPRFTPDGEYVLAVADCWWDDADPCCCSGIGKYNLWGTYQGVQLTQDLCRAGDFEISSDGEFVILVGSPGIGFAEPVEYGIYRTFIDGSSVQFLTPQLTETTEWNPLFMGGGGP